jgi:hypothetical protein
MLLKGPTKLRMPDRQVAFHPGARLFGHGHIATARPLRLIVALRPYTASVRSTSMPITRPRAPQAVTPANISIKIVADKRKKKVDTTVPLVVSGS